MVTQVNYAVAANANNTYDFSALRNYLDSIESFYGNFSMTVGDSSGILFEYSNGLMNPNVVLSLASGSKWPAVTALVGCFAANNISLDTPVNKFLSWWSTDRADEKSLVTLRHVLSMTTGMITDGGNGEINHVPAANISIVPEQAWLSCADMNGNVSVCAKAMYDAVADVAPVITPGTKFLYSSFGFQWAAAAAEIIEGRSTNDILETYVLQPADMSPVCYWDNQDTNPLLGGGLYCSARKLDSFVHGMLVDKIVSTESRIEMETVQLTDPSMYGTASIFWGPYCLGNWLECLNNLRTDKPMPVQCFRANKHGHPGAPICNMIACHHIRRLQWILEFRSPHCQLLF